MRADAVGQIPTTPRAKVSKEAKNIQGQFGQLEVTRACDALTDRMVATVGEEESAFLRAQEPGLLTVKMGQAAGPNMAAACIAPMQELLLPCTFGPRASRCSVASSPDRSSGPCARSSAAGAMMDCCNGAWGPRERRLTGEHIAVRDALPRIGGSVPLRVVADDHQEGALRLPVLRQTSSTSLVDG